MAKINVLDREVEVVVENAEDYICITDIARYKNAENTDDLIRSWLRNRNTVEFLGIWEQLNNPDFNPVQFDGFRKQAGLNSFTLTPKQWIEMTHARGIIAKPGHCDLHHHKGCTLPPLIRVQTGPGFAPL
jgi:hypothetical protein